MSKSEVIHTRIAPELKHSVEAILGKVGLSTSEAVTLFFNQVVLQKGLPFAVRVPNKTTRSVLKEAASGKGMKRYKSLDALRRSVEKPARAAKKKVVH